VGVTKGVSRKFSRGVKDRKIALLSLFLEGGGQQKKDRKITKKAENSAIKPLFITSVPCIKIKWE